MKILPLMAVALAAGGLFGDELTLPVTAVEAVAEFPVKTYPGRVVAVEKVDVVPQVSGEILEVCFKNGDSVVKGDVLYRIDPVKYAAAVKNAEAKVAECKANFSYAELSYTRHKKLLETRAVSIDAVDNALSQRDASRAALAAAEAELVAARDDLKHCMIVSPITGKLGTTAKTEGNYVNKGSETLVTIVQRDPIRVRFSMSNRELLEFFRGRWSKRREDALLTLTLADGMVYDEPGGAEYMENSADETTDTVQIYALFSNTNRFLKAGGTVSVTVRPRQGVKRPAIPATAVLQDVRGPYVWVVKADGAPERRYIARGDLNESGSMLFIEKGLAVGERVVSDGGHKVKPGMTVRAAP